MTMTEDERLRRLARALAADAPTDDVVRIETFGELATVNTGVELWQIERVMSWDGFVPGPGYRIYAARPGLTDSPRVRGFALLDDGRTFALDDRSGVSGFAATGAAEPLAIGHVAALYADAADYPRRILHSGDLSPTVAQIGPVEWVVTLHTARLDDSLDDDVPFDRIERWRVIITPAGATWSIEIGG
ncbi:MAG: hypothetical protein QM713_09570 [Arachnia sp.]